MRALLRVLAGSLLIAALKCDPSDLVEELAALHPDGLGVSADSRIRAPLPAAPRPPL